MSFILKLVLFPIIVLGANLYVTPSPLAGADCSQANPCAFQDALDTAEANSEADTIIVSPGIYYISTTLQYNPLSSETFDLIIIAEDKNNKPVLIGNGSILLLEINTSSLPVKIEINSLIFENGFAYSDTPYNASALKVEGSGADVYIYECEFRENEFESMASVVYIEANSVYAYMNIFSDNKNLSNSNRGHVMNIVSKYTYIVSNIFTNNGAYGYTIYDGSNIKVTYNEEVYIVNNIISNSTNMGGIYIYSTKFAYISGNVIDEVGGLGIGGCIIIGVGIGYIYGNYCGNAYSFSGSIYIYASDSFYEIVNNIIVSNLTEYTGGGIGIDIVFGISHIYITNNTIYGNKAGFSGGGIGIVSWTEEPGSFIGIYNNIIYGNKSDRGDDLFIATDANLYGVRPRIHLFNNLFTELADFENPTNDIIFIDPFNPVEYFHDGNLVGNPLFVDPANGDFRLQMDSPAINKGYNAAPAVPHTDFRGELRIIGDIVDIGAIEYSSEDNINIPNIEVIPHNINLENLPIGVPKEVDVLILNTGSSDLSIGGIEISGEGLLIDVEKGDNACGKPPFVIQPGGSCSIKVISFPINASLFEGMLKISSNDPDTPFYEIPILFKGVEWLDERSIKTDGGPLTFSVEGGFFVELGKSNINCKLPEGYKISSYGAFYVDISIRKNRGYADMYVDFPGDIFGIIFFVCGLDGKGKIIDKPNVYQNSLHISLMDDLDNKNDDRVNIYMAVIESGTVTKVETRKGCYLNDSYIFIAIIFMFSILYRRFRYNFNN